MKLSAFQAHLQKYPQHELAFFLPDGDRIAAHAHITEAGRVDKSFIDCGGTIRRTAACLLQAWVADDTDHRLLPGKLASVLEIAAPLFRGDDLDIEIEYEDCSISQFPVLEASASDETLIFRLGSKHTDCLAKDVCLPKSLASGACGATGCC
jgi:hypothetical protein